MSDIEKNLFVIPKNGNNLKIVINNCIKQIDLIEGSFEKKEQASLGFIDILRSALGSVVGVRICLFEPKEVKIYTDLLPINCTRKWGQGLAWEFKWNHELSVDESSSGDQLLSYISIYKNINSNQIALAFPIDLFSSENIA